MAQWRNGSIVYTRDQLMELRHSGEMGERHEIPKELRRKYRGCRAGRRRWVRKRRYRPYLPSIVMGNVRSLGNKLEELTALTRSDGVFREASVLSFTETWLNNNIPDSVVSLPGFQLVRGDRSCAGSGKKKGGGVAVFVNNKWCNPGHVTVKERVCCPDIELLALWNTFHPPELVRPALEKTLGALKLDYVDLYVIELPMAFKPGDEFYPKDEKGKYIYHPTDLCATWEALEACVDAGLAKSLGVSNFNRRQLELLLNKPGLRHRPVSNQVECHPYFTQPKLLEFCRQNNIVMVGYCPIGSSRDPSWVNLKSPSLLEDELLVSIGKKYGKSSAQVALRFNVQRGVVVIPKSFSRPRIKHNFQIFDFSLAAGEMEAIEALNRDTRFVELLMWSDHPEYPFHDEY